VSADFEAAGWREPWLARRAELTPDRVALQFGAGITDYGELQRDVLVLAERLAGWGVNAGDVVAVRLQNGPEFPRLLWAVRERGAVFLPLNPRWVAEETAHILRDSGACLLVDAGDAASEQAVRRAGGPVRAVVRGAGIERVPGTGRRPAPAREDLHDVLALLYTSGTSGPPKGALLSGAAFLASARASAQLLGTGPDDRWLACMPLFHVGGLSILLRACLAGSAVVVQRGFDPHAAARALESAAITGVSLVATMLQRLLDVRGADPPPPGLRRVLLGGGPAPEALLARAHALGYPLAPSYGLTEAASQVATRLPEDAAAPFDARLRALPGTELKVVGDDGRPRAPGQAGEICVRGGTLMRGYLGQPQATARALRQGWLHTGDMGMLDAGGRLRVLDRREDLIVSGGENIYPAEVEAVLMAHPAVLEAAVVGEPDAEFGARPLAWWVAAQPGSEAPDLASHCRRHLAGYKIPRRFVRVAELPRNAAGKLLRRAMRPDA
jgi:O-succinylbenzoic acid--CoA ligase